MRSIFRKTLIFLMVLGLAGGFAVNLVYADSHEDCACCAANKCHTNNKCHDDAPKACVCGHQVIQVCLTENNILPAPAFSGYLAQSVSFAYLYLSAKDIFHPPKV